MFPSSGGFLLAFLVIWTNSETFAYLCTCACFPTKTNPAKLCVCCRLQSYHPSYHKIANIPPPPPPPPLSDPENPPINSLFAFFLRYGEFSDCIFKKVSTLCIFRFQYYLASQKCNHLCVSSSVPCKLFCSFVAANMFVCVLYSSQGWGGGGEGDHLCGNKSRELLGNC